MSCLKRNGEKEWNISLTEIEALLGNLMLINTFTIGFIISFIISLSYQELVDPDKRFFTTWSASTTVWDSDAPDNVNDVIVISQVLCMRYYIFCISPIKSATREIRRA